MTKAPEARSFQLLRRLLLPAVRLCLRRSILIQDFIEMVKRVFVEAAAAELAKNGAKVNVSKINLMTGLYRHEITRLLKDSEPAPSGKLSVFALVTGRWEQHQKYCLKQGGGRVLSCDGEGSEFYDLVREVNSDIHPATVLSELERTGIVRRSAQGLRLVESEENISEDEEKLHELLANDLGTLCATVDDNLQTTGGTIGNLHIRTEYDNIYLKDLPEIRRWLYEQGREFHRKARQYLAGFDRDVCPNPDPALTSGAKVVVSAFSWTSPSAWEEPKQNP